MSFTKIHDAKYGWDLFVPRKFKDLYRDVSGGDVTTSNSIDIGLSEYKIWQLYQTKFSNDSAPYVQLIELIKSYVDEKDKISIWSSFETLMGKHINVKDKIKDVDVITKLNLKKEDTLENNRLIINTYSKDWLDYDSKLVDDVEIHLFDDYNKMIQEAIRVAKKKVYVKLYPISVNKDYVASLCEIDALVCGYTRSLVRQPIKVLYDSILGLEPYYKLVRYDNSYDPQNHGIKKSSAEIQIFSWY